MIRIRSSARCGRCSPETERRFRYSETAKHRMFNWNSVQLAGTAVASPKQTSRLRETERKPIAEMSREAIGRCSKIGIKNRGRSCNKAIPTPPHAAVPEPALGWVRVLDSVRVRESAPAQAPAARQGWELARVPQPEPRATPELALEPEPGKALEPARMSRRARSRVAAPVRASKRARSRAPEPVRA